MQEHRYFNRDISWLAFNGRVLQEAGRDRVPLMERIKFLSIYSSNLDEFFRVRMPILQAIHRIRKQETSRNLLEEANATIHRQQVLCGQYLKEIVTQLRQEKVHIVYNETVPSFLHRELSEYFFSEIAGRLQPVCFLKEKNDFFPQNNQLYFHLLLQDAAGRTQNEIINIPSDTLPRFTTYRHGDTTYVIFLDDVVRLFLPLVFRGCQVSDVCSFKITRDAEMDYRDEFDTDIADAIEKQLKKRDYGIATRLLHTPGIPQKSLEWLIRRFNLQNANIVQGGIYHNLKDLGTLSVPAKHLYYAPWPSVEIRTDQQDQSLYSSILERDILINPPYESYNTVLRFFNEAAIDKDVTEIFVTLYRAATHSRIIAALISAAQNGKEVTVLVELKARFDEANNIRWAKEMKAAGIRIVYSPATLKVHAKVALVKRKVKERTQYFALLGTGNLNETTARFYTDHILLTADKGLSRELELLFLFLRKKVKPAGFKDLQFRELLVAQFNLQQTFLALIDREMEHARAGHAARIRIKLNNLEEKVLISKLYEASNAGVTIELVVRGICCLVPGIPGQSEHITVRRIVDRYLEHGRIWIFENGGEQEIYLGSADWMNRNMYSRIEVCFKVKEPLVRQQLQHIMEFALQDNTQATLLDAQLQDHPLTHLGNGLQSQHRIYQLFQQLNNHAHE
jgi:polyphosphate kinase